MYTHTHAHTHTHTHTHTHMHTHTRTHAHIQTSSSSSSLLSTFKIAQDKKSGHIQTMYKIKIYVHTLTSSKIKIPCRIHEEANQIALEVWLHFQHRTFTHIHIHTHMHTTHTNTNAHAHTHATQWYKLPSCVRTFSHTHTSRTLMINECTRLFVILRCAWVVGYSCVLCGLFRLPHYQKILEGFIHVCISVSACVDASVLQLGLAQVFKWQEDTSCG